MTDDFRYEILTTAADADQFSRLAAQAFAASAEEEAAELNAHGHQQFRLLKQGHTLIGGLCRLPMGQWFGGQAVPMTGIASVAIAPTARGQGAAKYLMGQLLQELYAEGTPLSALYPATQTLYQRVGYGQGGTYCKWAIAASDIGVHRGPLPVSPLSLEDEAPFQHLYRQQAKDHGGWLDRPATIWRRILRPHTPQTIWAYRLGTADAPEGYVVFHQQRTDRGTTLVVRDWSLLSAAAAQSFWALMASHRSQIDQITWTSGALDPLQWALPEQTAYVTSLSRWLLRIVRVEAALEKRGYVPGTYGELHFQVEDAILPDNQGSYVLVVSDGQPVVRRGGRGNVKLSIGAMSALYSGLWSATQLQRWGLVTGDERDIATANRLFASPSPWLADFF